MDGLTNGRIVHCVVDGKHRAAIITRVWTDDGIVNLFVFPDASYEDQNNFRTSVEYDENNSEYTWHWIEKA